MTTDLILMTHPEAGGPVATNRKAFDQTWSGRGWQEITAKTRSVTRDDLLAEAEAAGVKVNPGATKAEIVEAIAAASPTP